MKTHIKNSLVYLSAALTCLVSSNCASISGAGVADYNRDGVISQAEAAQYNRQKDVEDRNVFTESNKRENAVDTVRDLNSAARNMRSFKNVLQNF